MTGAPWNLHTKRAVFEQLGAILTHYIAGIGYPAIFLLMTAESALIPIPSEITMPFSGFLAGQGYLNLMVVVVVGAVGNLVGSLLAFALGYWGSEAGVRGLIKKYGKWLLITVDEYDKAVSWFKNYGSAIAFFSRILPVVRTFISLPAGVARMNVVKFSLYTLLGSAIWSFVLAFLGFKLGENWKILGGYFHKFDLVFVLLTIAAGGFYVYHKVGKIRRQKD